MTVGDLIKELQKYPENKIVIVTVDFDRFGACSGYAENVDQVYNKVVIRGS